MRFLVFVAGLCLAGSAQAALVIKANPDVGAGAAAFGAATPLLSWANAFAPGSSWTTGVFGGPTLIAGTVTDGVTGSRSSAAHYVTNWIDGPGFGIGGAAGPDLAINGTEDFTLNFTGAVSRIGFAVASGRGLLPTEISNAGTSFAVLTNGGDSGSFSITDLGNGVVAWIDIIAANPFTMISFTETGGNLTDQYFGNIVGGVVPASSATPEPANWALLIAGFGLLGATMRRRRAIPEVLA